MKPCNIVDVIRAETAPFAGRLAVVDGALELTYAALLCAMDSVATTLRTQGVQPLERVSFLCEDGADYIIACLAILQKEHGWVSAESEELVAEVLGMPPIAVHEVTTFYNMFNQAPVGRVKLNVCTNLPCQLRGGQHALEHLCSRLGVEEGGTTGDGTFTVQQSECLGACADAPVLLVNDRQMVSFMTDARLDELVTSLGGTGAGAP